MLLTGDQLAPLQGFVSDSIPSLQRPVGPPKHWTQRKQRFHHTKPSTRVRDQRAHRGQRILGLSTTRVDLLHRKMVASSHQQAW